VPASVKGDPVGGCVGVIGAKVAPGGSIVGVDVGGFCTVGGLVGAAVPIDSGLYSKVMVADDPVSKGVAPNSSPARSVNVTPVLPGPSPSPFVSPMVNVYASATLGIEILSLIVASGAS